MDSAVSVQEHALVSGDSFRIQVHSSRLLLWFIILTHSTAAAIVWLIHWPWWLSGAISTAVLLSAFVSWSHHRWKGEKELQYSEGRWYWLVDYDKTEMLLAGEYFVSSWMIVMRFKPVDRFKKQALVLLSDSADKQDLRRLRVLLRYSLS